MSKEFLILFVLNFISANGQRVAPGVPPQHYQQYQQQPQQPQYQQPQHNLPPGGNHQQYQQQTQFQQVPVQQQPPIQQVPVHPQVPVQQIPQTHNGGHHAPHGHHGPQQVLNANIQHERDHIQEHMQVPMDTSKMSETELQFHYFKMHDTDGNNKLDGCELIKSLIHWHESDNGANQENVETKERVGKTYTDEQLVEAIDHILTNMDVNKDGYVSYVEYRNNEQKSPNSVK